eukprot:TRINITY_DN10769_c0_g1_i1.p1 TRINITY_DN10769_c0_g1~~TRINITY_DN10769_c0_g1_i1.p1  ORF type:complete len:259 (-),score=17.27 TRINITY_DN10769_c0_g1_i1:30-806(-)
MAAGWFEENENLKATTESSFDQERLLGPDLQQKFAGQVAGQLLESTKTTARSFLDIYANIDLIRPYFDVEQKEILWRLGSSLIPRTNTDLLAKSDLYGPVIIIFTLISVMLLGMKLSHTTIQEGTLMGTAFIICFTYWFLSSGLFYLLGYLFSIQITLLQFLSITGYGLFGVCLCLIVHCFFAGTIFDQTFLLLVGGSSSLSLGVLIFSSRQTSNQPNDKQCAFVGLLASGIQFLFLLYLKLYYATLYGAIANALVSE